MIDVAVQQPLGERLWLVRAIQRVPVCDLPDQRDKRMVLQVAPNAREVVLNVDARRAQLVGRPDAREQQQLR